MLNASDGSQFINAGSRSSTVSLLGVRVFVPTPSHETQSLLSCDRLWALPTSVQSQSIIGQ